MEAAHIDSVHQGKTGAEHGLWQAPIPGGLAVSHQFRENLLLLLCSGWWKSKSREGGLIRLQVLRGRSQSAAFPQPASLSSSSSCSRMQVFSQCGRVKEHQGHFGSERQVIVLHWLTCSRRVNLCIGTQRLDAPFGPFSTLRCCLIFSPKTVFSGTSSWQTL